MGWALCHIEAENFINLLPSKVLHSHCSHAHELWSEAHGIPWKYKYYPPTCLCFPVTSIFLPFDYYGNTKNPPTESIPIEMGWKGNIVQSFCHLRLVTPDLSSSLPFSRTNPFTQCMGCRKRCKLRLPCSTCTFWGIQIHLDSWIPTRV